MNMKDEKNLLEEDEKSLREELSNLGGCRTMVLLLGVMLIIIVGIIIRTLF